MPSFGITSQKHLDSCHPDIIKVFNVVITHVDCTILEGHRTMDRQREYFRAGQSKLDPDTPAGLKAAKHLSSPSKAVDALPYPIDWEDLKRIAWFAGFVCAVGRSLDPPVILMSGCNWDRDLTKLNSTGGFFDSPHYELV